MRRVKKGGGGSNEGTSATKVESERLISTMVYANVCVCGYMHVQTGGCSSVSFH